MKNFKLKIAYLAAFAMIFTSCSKEEATTGNDPDNMATLSFGALLNDLISDRAATKGHIGFLDGVPECSEGTAAYVEIILSRDGANVVGDDGEGNAYRVDLVNGQMFTEEDSELELEPGNYSLDYFAVFTADGTMIWIAPMGGDDDDLSNFVDNPLPLAIDLRAGVKKYVEVDVLCYDDRFVNEYGYLFFDINENEAIKFCIFGNVCPPSDGGRHFPASYSVNVWSGDDSSGTVLYNEVQNVTGTYDNGDFYAEPLCFALPDTAGEDEYYFEITLLNSDEYGDVVERVIRRGSITDDVVRTFFDGENNLEYFHFREGCDGEDNVPIFENPLDEEMYYKTCANSLNGSNSSVFAYFQVKGNVLKATVLAAGVTPNQMHPQHIHGLDSGANATCPPASADTDGNGLISIAEGLPFYGPVLLPLDFENGDFPMASSDGSYIYQRTFNISGLSISNWENLVVVAHGRMVDGSYQATLPVACGEVSNCTN
ncbi:hypothetical protein [Gillisia limnaea]|uniref:Membrane or secreted protein n=1 Tax=Gillisia limnaea (strain DSM 15749 / LMG 21470 / R-8282) TaxID=865937 RepID=H2BSC7_GILLR|nr:hypothetical protein [Gillisia limnaea]EHQ01450.1 membrane or secreted protein [Gillisia limnaea DSM 15749]